MGVIINASYMIKPAKPTWSGTFKLSDLDQIGIVPYVSTLFFYSNNNSSTSTNKDEKLIHTMKSSLSRALVAYHPLAGRLCWRQGGGKNEKQRCRLDVDCNSMGVEFIEAESSMPMTEFLMMPLKSNANGLQEQLVPIVDYGKPIQDLPIMLIQLTQFSCGGFALAVTNSHSVADGFAAFHFFQYWAKLARDDDHPLLTENTSPIIMDRDIFLRTDNNNNNNNVRGNNVTDFSQLPTLIGKENDFEERKKKVTVETLILTKNQVDQLKKMANNNTDEIIRLDHQQHKYSRFEVLTAHIWRCVCKAREHKSGEQETALSFRVSARGYMNPPLPPRYFGNAIVDMLALSLVGELLSGTLSHACQRIRAQKEKVNSDYVMSLIEYLRTQDDLSSFQHQVEPESNEGIFFGNPNLEVISWLNLPIHGLDFGWGKETYMSPGPHDNHYDGEVTILPTVDDDGSVMIIVGLQVAHMEKFRKVFYDELKY